MIRGMEQGSESASCPHSCFSMNQLYNHLTSQNWGFPICKMRKELTKHQQVTSQLWKHRQVCLLNPFCPVKVVPGDKQYDNPVARSQAADEWEIKCLYYTKLDNWPLNHLKLFYFTTTGEQLYLFIKCPLF